MAETDLRPGEAHVRRARALVRIMLPALREVARKHGYALAVHGTVARDIDLIAVPWREGATSAQSVMSDMFAAIKAVTGVWPSDGPLVEAIAKPYGRLAWSVRPGPEGPYFDISVVAREPPPKPKRKKRRR